MDKPWLKHYEPQVPASIEYPDMPVYKFLDDSAKNYPDHAATIYFGKKTTFSQLNSLADLFAETLPGLCFKPGDRVAIMLPNCPQMIAAYYGVLKARGVVVQINPLLSPPGSGLHNTRFGRQDPHLPAALRRGLHAVIKAERFKGRRPDRRGRFAPPAYRRAHQARGDPSQDSGRAQARAAYLHLKDMMAGKVVKACVAETHIRRRTLPLSSTPEVRPATQRAYASHTAT